MEGSRKTWKQHTNWKKEGKVTSRAYEFPGQKQKKGEKGKTQSVLKVEVVL